MVGDKLEVVGYGVIPMIDIKRINNATSNAHFFEEYVFDKKCIQADLKQAVQYLYSKMHYEPDQQGEKKTSLHEILYHIDFPGNNSKGKVMIQTSFTYLHWKIAEALKDEDSRYSTETLDLEQF